MDGATPDVAPPGGLAATRCLAQLPPPQRDAVLLACRRGLTYRDVARRLGISEATAKDRIRTGLAMMRRLLDEATVPQEAVTISRARS